jgi:hypothetical protein
MHSAKANSVTAERHKRHIDDFCDGFGPPHCAPLDPDIVSAEVTSLKGVAMSPLNVRFGS